MFVAGKRREDVWRRLRGYADKALHLLLPPACVVCRRPGAIICQGCESSLTFFSPEACPGCGRRLPAPGLPCAWCGGRMRPLREIRAVCRFEGAAQAAVHALKYDGLFGVAQPLGAMMAARYPPWRQAPHMAIAIPLHPERVRERGYNQATHLARRLCREVGLPLDEGALWRTRNTAPQVGLSRSERRQNVAGAFAADAERVRGKRLLLIDDVCTSGATLAAAAEALLESGATGVSAYCFARPLPQGSV